jgi:hypothetical protein
MEVGQGPNWGCRTKRKKKTYMVITIHYTDLHIYYFIYNEIFIIFSRINDTKDVSVLKLCNGS